MIEISNPNDRYKRLMPEGVPRYVRVYDNEGKSVDRYTVVFTGRYRHKTSNEFWVLAMSGAPTHPQGFCQHLTYPNVVDYPTYSHIGKKIKFADLPENCRKIVRSDYMDLWDIKTDLDDKTKNAVFSAAA